MAETDAAIERAHEAFPAWRALPPGERAALLRRFAAVVDAHVEELAELEVRNAGHTWGNATLGGRQRPRLPELLLRRARSGCSAGRSRSPGGIDITFHEPLGVVGDHRALELPDADRRLGVRARAGRRQHAWSLKPAELTPLTAIRIGELALEAGLPEGVLTVIPGKGSVVGERFVTHPLVRKVCFTGSTAVGKRIMAGCAEQVKRVTLELGGKSANVDLRRRRPAPRRPRRRRTPSSTTRARTAARARGSWSSASAYDEFLGLLRAGRRRDGGARPGRPRPARWAR